MTGFADNLGSVIDMLADDLELLREKKHLPIDQNGTLDPYPSVVQRSRREVAERVVSKLAGAGYSIVQHVQPTKDEDCGQVWLAGVMAEGFHLAAELGSICDFGGTEYTVEEARRYAAAMLTAADAAEEGHV